MSEDHRFKRIIKDIEEIKEDNKTAEHAEKVREFQWVETETEDEEVGGELLTVSMEKITECASLLSKHLMSNIAGEHFAGMDNTGIRFVIPVSLDLHELIRQRFEMEWSLDSRLDVFQLIREQLVAEFATEEKRAELDAKIQEALPSTHRKKFTSGEVCLEDDAMVVGDESDMVSIEIPIHFVANL